MPYSQDPIALFAGKTPAQINAFASALEVNTKLLAQLSIMLIMKSAPYTLVLLSPFWSASQTSAGQQAEKLGDSNRKKTNEILQFLINFPKQYCRMITNEPNMKFNQIPECRTVENLSAAKYSCLAGQPKVSRLEAASIAKILDLTELLGRKYLSLLSQEGHYRSSFKKYPNFNPIKEQIAQYIAAIATSTGNIPCLPKWVTLKKINQTTFGFGKNREGKDVLKLTISSAQIDHRVAYDAPYKELHYQLAICYCPMFLYRAVEQASWLHSIPYFAELGARRMLQLRAVPIMLIGVGLNLWLLQPYLKKSLSRYLIKSASNQIDKTISELNQFYRPLFFSIWLLMAIFIVTDGLQHKQDRKLPSFILIQYSLYLHAANFILFNVLQPLVNHLLKKIERSIFYKHAEATGQFIIDSFNAIGIQCSYTANHAGDYYQLKFNDNPTAMIAAQFLRPSCVIRHKDILIESNQMPWRTLSIFRFNLDNCPTTVRNTMTDMKTMSSISKKIKNDGFYHWLVNPATLEIIFQFSASNQNDYNKALATLGLAQQLSNRPQNDCYTFQLPAIDLVQQQALSPSVTTAKPEHEHEHEHVHRVTSNNNKDLHPFTKSTSTTKKPLKQPTAPWPKQQHPSHKPASADDPIKNAIIAPALIAAIGTLSNADAVLKKMETASANGLVARKGCSGVVLTGEKEYPYKLKIYGAGGAGDIRLCGLFKTNNQGKLQLNWVALENHKTGDKRRKRA